MGVISRVKVPNGEGSSNRSLRQGLVADKVCCSPMHRVSVATRNLKEAGGKPLARGTRTSSEASDRWMSLPNKTKSLLPKSVESK